MSTMQSIDQIHELRMNVAQVNNEINILSHIAYKGKLDLRDYLVLVRALTGGNPELNGLISNMQLAITTTRTAISLARLAKIEMATNPLLWPVLAVGTFAGLTAYTIYESTVGV